MALQCPGSTALTNTPWHEQEDRTDRPWIDALWPIGAGVIAVGIVGLCLLPISIAGMMSRVYNPHLRRLLLLLCGVVSGPTAPIASFPRPFPCL